MTEIEVYKKVILCVIYACNELGFANEEEIEVLKVLFRALHYAEKREQDGKL